MSGPNIVNVSSIVGRTAVAAVGTTAAAIVTNPADSNKVFKVNALIVSNVDGSASADVSVELFRSNVAYRLASTVTVPADASLEILSKPLYLEEGDSLRVFANVAGDVEAICSYEEIA
jgi:hypothetical protein